MFDRTLMLCPGRSRRLFALVAASSLSLCALASAAVIVTPALSDTNLSLTLVASEPDIVTPIGAAVDARGRLFVIESHTHQVKPDYPGPKSDRVKVFTDTNADGIPDRSLVFAEGFRYAMNLAFSPDGTLYLTHRNGVFILRDRNGDGVGDERKEIVRMETKANYPHNGLHGIAFSHDGWMYLGTGENTGEAYSLHGSDGSTWNGNGNDGAFIFRCRPDGSQLEQFARGGWNFFALECDGAGHLFALDNDPDGSPPCRLLHVVQGGDYGYQYRYGRGGQHPYVCWNGELPGTLPMLAGTGEAPSGILDARLARLGTRYRDGMLVTSWGDNEVEWFGLKPRGASFSAARESVLRGEENFRPVAVAAAPDGSVFITDWGNREYSVHGKGRIWRLAAKNAGVGSSLTPAALMPPGEARFKKLISASSAADYRKLRLALRDDDPFIRSAAITALTRPAFHEALLADAKHSSPEVRRGLLLALRRSGSPPSESLLTGWLRDPDPDVRRLALIWVGEAKVRSLREAAVSVLTHGTPTATVFKTYLATMDLLQREDAITARTAPAVQQLVVQVLEDRSQPPSVKALALVSLPNPNEPKAAALVLDQLSAREPILLREAIRAAAMLTNTQAGETLLAIARDQKLSISDRADAVAALAGRQTGTLTALLPLLSESDNHLRRTVVRTLRGAAQEPQVRQELEQLRSNLPRSSSSRPLAAQIDFALRGALAPGRPRDDIEWRAAVRTGGDPTQGRRVFSDPQLGCARCHTVQGRGGDVGPDVSTIARSNDRARLIDSILNPSREIGPFYEQKIVETKNGELFTGVPWGIDFVDTVTLKTADGAGLRLRRDDIVSIQTSSVSIMPEDLEQGMTVEDFRDLLAYLLTLR
jgi:hypothetical protein